MRYRPLGKSGIVVSELGLGCGFLGHAAGFDGPRLLSQALELGVTLYDTADFYGDTELWLGRAFENNRDQVVLATKFGMLRRPDGNITTDFSVAHMRKVLDSALKRLRTDVIDLFQLHSPPPEVLDDLELLEALRAAKRAGKIRGFGLSLYGVELMRQAILRWQPDALQVDFNLYDQQAREIFAEAEQAGVGLLARRPLDSGMLGGDLGPDARLKPGDPRQRWGAAVTERRQALLSELEFLTRGRSPAEAALAFVLSHSAISAAIPSTVNLAHLKQNAAVAGRRLSANELERATSLAPKFMHAKLGV